MRGTSVPVSGSQKCVAGVSDWSDERKNNTFALPKLFLTRLLREGFASSCELVKFIEFWEFSSKAGSCFFHC